MSRNVIFLSLPLCFFTSPVFQTGKELIPSMLFDCLDCRVPTGIPLTV